MLHLNNKDILTVNISKTLINKVKTAQINTIWINPGISTSNNVNQFIQILCMRAFGHIFYFFESIFKEIRLLSSKHIYNLPLILINL